MRGEDGEVAAKLNRFTPDVEAAELKVYSKALQVELIAKQAKKGLLASAGEISRRELSNGHTCMRELRAADSPFPDENKAAMSRRILFTFRLHVAGQAQHSIQAITNLAALRRTHLSYHCETGVVDVFHEPQRAPGDSVFLMPTLIKLLPMLVRCVFSTLKRTRTALLTLRLESSAA